MAPKPWTPKWGGSNRPTLWKGSKSGGISKEDIQKIKKTIWWYNKHGGLQKELSVNAVMGPLKRMGRWRAFATLKGLEEKASQLENPTAWVLGSAKKAGAIGQLDPQADRKVRKTVTWYNANGGLQQPLNYTIVSTALHRLKPKMGLKILKELEEKGPELTDPNGWVSHKAKQVEKEYTIKKMAYWLNTKGGLKAELYTDAIVWPLSSLDLWQAKDILNKLNQKRREVTNPTAWVNGWARKVIEKYKTSRAETQATPKKKSK